ncbi:MAG TPA: hypothetical protein VIX86_20020 [Streptosporangiaceae bacterium]
MSPPPMPGGLGTGYAPPRRLRPGRIWYLVALLVFAAGVAWLVIGLLSIGSQVNSFPRVPIPRGGQVSLSQSGGYVVYYEGPGAQSGNVPSVNVRVIPASPGAAVRSLTPYTSSVTYGFGSHQGRAVLSLEVAHPGRFAVVTSGGAVPAGADLAFGHSLVSGIAGTALLTVLLMLLGVAGGITVFVIRIVRKSRARSAVAVPVG